MQKYERNWIPRLNLNRGMIFKAESCVNMSFLFFYCVIPAQAGIQTPSLRKQGTIKMLDSCFRRNDVTG
ncbi:MAG TPA: hypothetical protein DEP99_06210 [Nitrospiraceae bacterium]|nr:hypothetical protein [Nitrospiraceae bacterium]